MRVDFAGNVYSIDMIDESIFKSYDIRGVYKTQLTEDVAKRIGRACAQYLGAQTIAVGRDMRASSPSLFEAFVEGVRDHGTNVLDLGLVNTPMLYHASATLPVDGAVMITASHNPGEYNGMKCCRQHAIPIGKASGLMEIKALALAEEMQVPVAVRGTIIPTTIAEKFHQATRQYAHFDATPFSLVIDTGNAMGALELPLWRSFPDLTIEALFEELDGSFPNHEANPLNIETLEELCKTVRQKSAPVGIAYDGDADRVGFVDETGAPVSGDLMLAIIAREVLKTAPGKAVLYDVRCSRAVPEIIAESGGIPIETPVGHSNIKALMREHDAVFAGEYSQHYYFSDFAYAENSTLAALLLLNQMHTSGKPLSELVREVRRYYHSGEVNCVVADPNTLFATLKDAYHDGTHTELDGVKVSYPDWWFSVRASNTEPLVRLNLEADSEALLNDKRAELTALFGS